MKTEMEEELGASDHMEGAWPAVLNAVDGLSEMSRCSVRDI